MFQSVIGSFFDASTDFITESPMKTRILFALFVSPVALARATPAPIYEENFNTPSANIKYTNGADLGGSGSGVSEKLADRAYVGAPASTQNERNGPACLALKPIAPNPLSAFTCTFWYYLDEQGPVLQVPLSTAGVLFLMHDKGFEVRIENQLEAPRSYVFSPGINGPYASWRARGRSTPPAGPRSASSRSPGCARDG